MFLNMLLVLAQIACPGSLSQLKNDLVQAEAELEIVQKKISSLAQDIAERELALIKEELAIFHARAIAHKGCHHDESTFQHEREILSQIIKTVPNYRDEAFHLQNQVLSLITNFRDEQDVVINEEEQEVPLR